MEETQALSKRASEVWKTYSIAEKQVRITRSNNLTP
jgi:hypothetical protein